MLSKFLKQQEVNILWQDKDTTRIHVKIRTFSTQYDQVSPPWGLTQRQKYVRAYQGHFHLVYKVFLLLREDTATQISCNKFFFD